jgi:ABC-2 type transport system permease protein
MAFADRFAGTRVFVATEMRVQFHEWPAIATGTMVQAIMVVFVAVLAPALLPLALIGSLAYSMFLIGQRVLNEAAYIRIDHKLNELYHASPLTPESYFLGISAGILIAYLPTVLLLFGILEIIHPLALVTIGVLVLVLLAVWAFSSTIGYVISTLFRDMRTIWPYSSLLTNLFGIVPPVFYPLRLVPAVLQPVVLAMPTSAAAALVNWAEGIEPLATWQVALAAGSLALEAVLSLLFGIYWARKTAREA